MKKGFTLVELSIVLVIIGLLIGGILVAQSMIESAKISATARKIAEFDAATVVFKDKFKYLPGDSPYHGGNGNGLVTGAALPNHLLINNCEIANFWYTIWPDKFTQSVCNGQGVAPTAKGSAKNVPSSPIGSSGSYFIASANSDASMVYADADSKNYYAILEADNANTLIAGNYRFNGKSNAKNYVAAVHATELLALDKKIDDGIANSGYVISGRMAAPNNNGGLDISADEAFGCSTGGIYEVNDSLNFCTPVIRIGGVNGMPQ